MWHLKGMCNVFASCAESFDEFEEDQEADISLKLPQRHLRRVECTFEICQEVAPYNDVSQMFG